MYESKVGNKKNVAVQADSAIDKERAADALVKSAAEDDDDSSTTTPSRTTFRMVALDLDGTLLSQDHQLAEEQAVYLRDLYQRHGGNFKICLATGRAAPSIYEHVAKLNLPAPLPVVCSNGARGFELMTGNKKNHHHLPTELFYFPVPRQVVEVTVQLASKHGYAVQYYLEDSIYVNSNAAEHQPMIQAYTELTGSTILYSPDNFGSMLEQDQLPSKLLVIFPEDQVHEATEIYQKGLDKSATIVGGTYDWFLEVLHPQVTKGFGLQQMCDYLKIPIGECIAMGDGANDLEFLQQAGLGLAMKNAKVAAKEHADQTIEWTNQELGVMKALQQLEREGRIG